jgi:hypothetical protein
LGEEHRKYTGFATDEKDPASVTPTLGLSAFQNHFRFSGPTTSSIVVLASDHKGNRVLSASPLRCVPRPNFIFNIGALVGTAAGSEKSRIQPLM